MPLTGPATKQLTVSGTATQLVAADPTRSAIYFTNESDTIIRIGDSTVDADGGTAADIGLAIPAGTGPILLATDRDTSALDATHEFYVIADGSSKKCSVMELFSK